MVQIDYTLHIKDFWNTFPSPRCFFFQNQIVVYMIQSYISFIELLHITKFLAIDIFCIKKRFIVTIFLYYSSALSLRSKGFDMIFQIVFWSLNSLNVTWVPFHELHISIGISYNWNYEKCNKSLLWCPKCSILMCFHPFNCIFF